MFCKVCKKKTVNNKSPIIPSLYTILCLMEVHESMLLKMTVKKTQNRVEIEGHSDE